MNTDLQKGCNNKKRICLAIQAWNLVKEYVGIYNVNVDYNILNREGIIDEYVMKCFKETCNPPEWIHLYSNTGKFIYEAPSRWEMKFGHLENINEPPITGETIRELIVNGYKSEVFYKKLALN